jgi:chemotaxis protein MotA
MAESQRAGRSKLDFQAVAGLLVGVGGILAGLTLEGGKLADVGQTTAVLIVLGGTIGAVMLTTPHAILKRALRRLRLVFFVQDRDPHRIIDEIVVYAAKARKSGVISLEDDVPNISDTFLRKAISLAVDGVQLQVLRSVMELDMHMEEADMETDARVYESAGGYAPTIGIIGAVIGLIQVMKHLNDLNRVGYGIAVAFVATIYGVGFANLFCLPAGQKIRLQAQQTVRMKALMVEGVISLVEGMNPRLIRRKLDAFTRSSKSDPGMRHRVEPELIARTGTEG